MKTILGLLSCFLAFFISYGQEKYIYEFEKLAITDTLFDKEQIKTLKTESEYFYAHYFVVGRYFEGESDKTIYCIIKQEDTYWISYTIPYEYGIHDRTSLIGPAENKNYFLASSYYNYLSPGAGHGNETTIKKLIIIDIENNSFIEIESYTKEQYWQVDEEDEAYEINDENLMISNFLFENNHLTILNSCFTNQNLEKCTNPGGLYEFQKDRLKKIKNYNPETMGFTAINYIDKIAIGMSLEELKLVYPNAQISQKKNIYGTCADAETGFEISNDDQILGFALSKPKRENSADKPEGESIDYANEKIISFIVVSPSFNFGKININSTVSEILKIYPQSNVRLDLLSEWEHLFIKELNIELVFKTDETNRMGIYENEEFVKINNGKAKADFIQVY